MRIAPAGGACSCSTAPALEASRRPPTPTAAPLAFAPLKSSGVAALKLAVAVPPVGFTPAPTKFGTQLSALLPMPNLQAGIEGVVVPGAVIQSSPLFQPTIQMPTMPPGHLLIAEVRKPEVFAQVRIEGGASVPGTSDAGGVAGSITGLLVAAAGGIVMQSPRIAGPQMIRASDGPNNLGPNKSTDSSDPRDPDGLPWPTTPPRPTDGPPVTIWPAPMPEVGKGWSESELPGPVTPRTLPTQFGAVGREKCLIRLSATILGDRKSAVVSLDGDCDRYVKWIAHSLDLMSSSRVFLVPTTDEGPGTYDQVRAWNPYFIGTLYALPSAMLAEATLLDEGGAYNPARDTAGYLTTNALLADWAMAVDNSRGRSVPPGSTPVDYLPYAAYWVQSSEKEPLPAELATSLGYSSTAKFRCKPMPFAINPDHPDAHTVFMRAILDTCPRYGATAVMTDDQTTTYTPGAVNLVVKLNVPTRPSVCAPTLAGAEFAMIRDGDGTMFTAAQYTDYRPDVCRGRGRREFQGQQLERDRDTCRFAINVERNKMMGRAALALNDASWGMLRVWPNLYTLFDWQSDGEEFPRVAEDREFGEFLASLVGSKARVLSSGGWWEKFCCDWNVNREKDDDEGNPGEDIYPAANDVPTNRNAPIYWTNDGRQRTTVLTNELAEPRVELAIYRQSLVAESLWVHSMRWVSETVKHGGTIRVESGFTSIDELHFSLASYLMCRINAPSNLRQWDDVPDGVAIPFSAAVRLLDPVVSIFPRFVHADQARSWGLQCVGNAGACEFDCVPGGQIATQQAVATHPVIAQDTIGGPYAHGDDRDARNYLRLLLDVELGPPVGFGQRNGMFFARFQYGEVVAYPIPTGSTVKQVKRWKPLQRYRPVPPGGQTAYYLAVDAPAVDELFRGGEQARRALEGRVPSWALTIDERSPNPSQNLQRALESGLQDAGDPASGRRGVPGICLRRFERDSAGIPPPPGTGKVIVYSNSPSAELWRNYFPEPVLGTAKTVSQSAQNFILVGGLSVGLAPQGAGWRKP